MTCQVQVMLLNGASRDDVWPNRASSHAAGYDLISASENAIEIAPGRRVLVPSGIAIALPEGFEAQIRPRSGLALKHGVTVLNSPGTIDADYRGEIRVILVNFGDENFVVTRGMRIAQMVIARVAPAELVAVDVLGETARGEGGFGSTGTCQLN